ncbi:MAG: tryptophan 7-halogenase, partial [Myxococcota bacterium]
MTLFHPSRRSVAILGGGSAGIAMAAYLQRQLNSPNITLFESSTILEYREFWPLIGFGYVPSAQAIR